MPDFKKLNEETLDIKGLILSYTQYWYYFLISLIFFISIAFLYIRFTIPEYSVYTTLKISNNEKSIIDELDVFEKSNLTNEIIYETSKHCLHRSLHSTICCNR